MNKSCLVVGDLNIDLIFFDLKRKPLFGSEILSKDYFIHIGGSAGIFATVLSQLEIDTSIFSKIGNDYFGKLLIKQLSEFGVNTDQVIIDKKNNTGITVNLPYANDRYQFSSFSIFKDLNFEILKIPESLSHIHITAYYMIKKFNKKYIEIISGLKNTYKDITFSLDTNDDPENNWNDEIYEVIPNMDILFLNKKEAQKITRENKIEFALEKLGNYVKVVILKLGNKGYLAKTPQGNFLGQPIKTNVCDTTGAGDNFDAGFIYGYLNDFSFENSLRIANLCGANSVEQIGGVGDKKRFLKLKKLLSRFC